MGRALWLVFFVWMQQLVKARSFTLIRNGELTFSNGFFSPQKFLRQFLWVCYKVVAQKEKALIY